MSLNFLESKVLVIGDLMLDKYYYGKVSRISPEAPVPVVNVKSEKRTLGGAGNVANNLINLGCDVYLISCIGKDQNALFLKQILQENDIKYFLLERENVPTITKLRVLGEMQQMLRIDFEEVADLNVKELELIKREVIQTIKKVNLVILSDYNKGVLGFDLSQLIIKECKQQNIKVIVDPKGKSWIKYEGASIITPNLKEFGEAVNLQFNNNEDDENIKSYGQVLIKDNRLENLLVTRSEKGMSLISGDAIVNIPTKAKEVYDVSGAGDTVIATLGAALSSNYDLLTSVKLANAAAGVVVGKIGTAPITLPELQENFKI